ncbi:MAG: hypothetical protein LIO93_09240 [Bacteroidales bacterium]|nr:hypothetical protein [Bacteroidales bacterium]
MSINKDIMRTLLYSYIPRIPAEQEKYNLTKADIELITYLINKVLDDDPVEDCRIKGSRKDWKGLPSSKSLFYTKKIAVYLLETSLLSYLVICICILWIVM